MGTESVRELVAKIRKRRDALQRWTHAKVLIIDEVSMLDGHLFDKLDQVRTSPLAVQKRKRGRAESDLLCT